MVFWVKTRSQVFNRSILLSCRVVYPVNYARGSFLVFDLNLLILEEASSPWVSRYILWF